MSRHQAYNRGGIDSSRKKGAEWNIRDHPNSHGLLEALQKIFRRVARRISARKRGAICGPKIPRLCYPSALGNEVSAWHELADAGEESGRRRYIPVREVLPERGTVNRCLDARKGQYGFDFRSEQQEPITFIYEERLFAIPVA